MIDEAAARRVRRVLRAVPGVRQVDIRLKYAAADIRFDEARTSVDGAIAALETAGLAAYRSPACCELPPR